MAELWPFKGRKFVLVLLDAPFLCRFFSKSCSGRYEAARSDLSCGNCSPGYRAQLSL
jgi:hypothetical protein